MRSNIVTIPILLLSMSAYGKTPTPCDLAKRIVNEFIQYDLKGETTHTSKIVDSLIDYKGRDLPGWDSIVLTRKSKITDCKEAEKRVDVTILHSTYGVIAGEITTQMIDQKLKNAPHKEIQILRLNSTQHGWRIDSATIDRPHVSIETARGLAREVAQ